MPPCMAEIGFVPDLAKLWPLSLAHPGSCSLSSIASSCCARAEDGAAGCVSAASLLINKPH